MSKVFIEESTLTAIGDSIRGKSGKSDLIAPLDMPAEIDAIETGGGGLPPEVLVISGSCGYMFRNSNWNWLIDDYGNQVSTQDITNTNSMFCYNDAIENIPFDFNFNTIYSTETISTFEAAQNLKAIGDFKNLKAGACQKLFNGCYKLRYLPNFVNCDWSYIQSYAYGNMSQMFTNCYSLRNISEDLVKELYKVGNNLSYNYHPYYSMFSRCYVLDEIKGLMPADGTYTTNIFRYTFDYCNRVKDITFALDNGAPYTRTWSNQTIDLSAFESSYGGVGCTSITVSGDSYLARNITNYNSGLTMETAIYDDATYQANKDNPDSFAPLAYSRYNHDSAVNTINSLPDCSSGSSNVIKFTGASGSLTDGGAINTLTEAEIAVAAAKGWTVTLV